VQRAYKCWSVTATQVAWALILNSFETQLDTVRWNLAVAHRSEIYLTLFLIYSNNSKLFVSGERTKEEESTRTKDSRKKNNPNGYFDLKLDMVVNYPFNLYKNTKYKSNALLF